MNALLLALTWYAMPAAVLSGLLIANGVFTLIFVLELAIKVTGLGIVDYFSSGPNIFDALITAVRRDTYRGDIKEQRDTRGAWGELAKLIGWRRL